MSERSFKQRIHRLINFILGAAALVLSIALILTLKGQKSKLDPDSRGRASSEVSAKSSRAEEGLSLTKSERENKAMEHNLLDTPKGAAEDIAKRMGPKDAFAELRTRFKGSELTAAFNHLAWIYGPRNFESVEEFIRNLPPGDRGKSALVNLMSAIDLKWAPQTFELLYSSSGRLGEKKFKDASRELFKEWGKLDFENASSFIRGFEADNSEKAQWLGLSISRIPGEEAVTFMKNLEPQDLKDKLDRSPLGIASYARAGEYAALYEALEGAGEELDLQVTENALRETKSIANALSELQKSQVHGKEKLTVELVSSWVGRDTVGALEFLSELADEDITSGVISESYKDIAEAGPQAAREWAETVKNEEVKKEILKFLEK